MKHWLIKFILRILSYIILWATITYIISWVGLIFHYLTLPTQKFSFSTAKFPALMGFYMGFYNAAILFSMVVIRKIYPKFNLKGNQFLILVSLPIVIWGIYSLILCLDFSYNKLPNGYNQEKLYRWLLKVAVFFIDFIVLIIAYKIFVIPKSNQK